MNNKGGLLNAECGRNFAEPVCARSPFSIQHSSFSIRPSRGLTLIELLVTIVIMVTVLAGVLPMVSPNNNARKIREASRQLSSLMAQAQAQAARDGRPYGVAFQEFTAGDNRTGMSLEAFTIAEPQRFAGFSEWSRVSVAPIEKVRYGRQGPDDLGPDNPVGNGGVMFDPKYRGATVWQLSFWLYGQLDLVPPRMIRNGDVLNIDRNLFLIVDDDGSVDGAHQVDPDTGYLLPMSQLNAIWLNNHGQQPPAGVKPYFFRRQPTNTSDAPLQFPRGIGIDLQASGADGLNVPFSFDSGGVTTVGLMFSPNGALDAIYRDGVRMEGVEQVFMLMGLFENGNDSQGSQDDADYDFKLNPPVDNADMAQRRTRLNWLSADSRWVTANRAGRIITSENNTSFDPAKSPYIDDLSGTPEENQDTQRRRQIESARQYAKQMTGSSGR